MKTSLGPGMFARTTMILALLWAGLAGAARSQIVTEFPIAASSPEGIAAGPDGNLWFTEFLGNEIGRITTGGFVTEFPIPTAGSWPSGIAAGPDGNLWFTESLGSKIGQITTAGLVTEIPIPTAGGKPSGISAGPDGNLWFTERDAGQIGRITTAGVVTEFPVPTAGSGPVGIAADSVTREQMAVFLMKSKLGAAEGPPPATGSVFADVPASNPFAPWIEQLSGFQITGGCGGGDYCPGSPVTRAQMAVFLLKAEHGSTYTPPACAGIFGDVTCPSDFADWIEQLSAEGITGGCGGGNYCPDGPSTRGQMAVFLVKTFGLQLYGP